MPPSLCLSPMPFLAARLRFCLQPVQALPLFRQSFWSVFHDRGCSQVNHGPSEGNSPFCGFSATDRKQLHQPLPSLSPTQCWGSLIVSMVSEFISSARSIATSPCGREQIVVVPASPLCKRKQFHLQHTTCRLTDICFVFSQSAHTIVFVIHARRVVVGSRGPTSRLCRVVGCSALS